MRRARTVLLFPLLVAVLLLAGCNDSQQADNPRGFNLTGRYPIVVSGTEGGVPFEAIGYFDLVTDADNDVSGSWELFGPPPTVQSGTLTGKVEQENFDFVLEQTLPPSPCGGAEFVGNATVLTFTKFVGRFGGGCATQELSVRIATQD
jgi:hypothetical protein